MGQPASIAPKERVNIVYRSATGDAKEEVELPLKILVLGDFTQRAEPTPVEDRAPVNIDKDNFDEVLRAHQLRLQASVPDCLSGAPDAQLALDMEFTALRDFEPDAIVARVPELQRLMDLRDALKALKGPLGNIPEFRKKLQELSEDPGFREQAVKELGLE
jgi:type VI secretion system protein ImpB